MDTKEIIIRNNFEISDLEFVIHRHSQLYTEEYNYETSFETYVRTGLYEFYESYNPELDSVWICEHNEKIVGFILLMHRESKTAQLRYFYLEPELRTIGLGKKLMSLFMDFFKEKKYESCYLWTTNELQAAVSLYKRYGFELTEEKESAVFGKTLIEQRYDLMM